jgi:Serine dehydrogenase proteinase
VGLNDTRNKRLELIKQIEAKLNATLLVYFTADSPIVQALIAEDAVLPMYDHLRAMGKRKRLALYLYSLGGQLETPWKMITMLREFCDELHVVVPYKAYSAATMIAIGTDKIHMTSKSELGPIDPALQVSGMPNKGGAPPKLPDLGVEDVAAYLAFVRDRAGLKDEAAVSAAVQALAQDLTPPLLGRIERIYSHIRLVARNLLTQHKPPLSDEVVSDITVALTEKMYVHGHGIGRKEAKGIGLDVEFTDAAAEAAIWSLYEEYESVFRLRDTKDIESYVPANNDTYERPDTPLACIESELHLHEFACKVWAQKIRAVPANPAINVNLGFNFPPNINPQQLPQQMQLLIQQILQQAAQQLPGLVAQELQRQSPATGIIAKGIGGVWRKIV